MARNHFKPPETRVADIDDATDVPAYEPENPRFFFSSRGRLGRKQYWLNGVSSAYLSIVVFAILAALIGQPWLVHAGKLLIAWSSTVLVARRAHDFGFSGWWAASYVAVLLAGAPVMAILGFAQGYALLITFAVLLAFGLIPGDRNANHFGLPQAGDTRGLPAV